MSPREGHNRSKDASKLPVRYLLKSLRDSHKLSLCAGVAVRKAKDSYDVLSDKGGTNNTREVVE